MSAMAAAASDEGFMPLGRNPSGSFRSGAEMSEITGGTHFMHEQAACAPGTLPPPKVTLTCDVMRPQPGDRRMRRLPRTVRAPRRARARP